MTPSKHAAPAVEIDNASHIHHGSLAALAVGALGIVFGDIGTSPLYAMQQIFFATTFPARPRTSWAASRW